jgi:hypothetical protein|tara:strand:- start:361 stop:555 length:195 start_codon:yes stop_codon:yes gene_type:complete
MTDKELEERAEEAKLLGDNDLAAVLYTYLGSKHAGMGSEFARYCQTFAKEGVKEIEMYNSSRNN